MVAQNWGYKYNSCLKCNTTIRPHKARGMCSRCHPKLLTEKCSICKKHGIVSRRLKTKPICSNCNKKYYNPVKKRICSLCNNLGRIDKKYNGLSVCSNCNKKYYYKQPKKECANCKEIEIVRGYNKNLPYCNSCYAYKFYTKPKFNCDICNKLSKTSAIIENKRYCHKCYKHIRKEHFISLRLWCRNKYSKRLSDDQINYISSRDKKCVYCGNENNLTFDHIVPVSKGGKSELDNLVIACRTCNLSKNKSDVALWCKRKSIPVPLIVLKLLENRKATAAI